MPDIYEELGVRPVLNAQGNRTLLGGSTPSPAVREAPIAPVTRPTSVNTTMPLSTATSLTLAVIAGLLLPVLFLYSLAIY